MHSRYRRVSISSLPSERSQYYSLFDDQAQNMSANAAASKCPFLTRVPASFLGHAGASLNMYGQRCPVMARMFHRSANGAAGKTAPVARTLTLGEL